jgi:hypothetical protein
MITDDHGGPAEMVYATLLVVVGRGEHRRARAPRTDTPTNSNLTFVLIRDAQCGAPMPCFPFVGADGGMGAPA